MPLSHSDWDVNEAVPNPFYAERLACVRDRLVADILTRAIVDLHVGLLDDVYEDHNPAARLRLTTGQAHALEIEALARARRQQVAIREITDGAGARPVCGEQYV